jgi:hypothetical protein
LEIIVTAPLSDLTKRDKEFIAFMDDTARREWIKAIVERMIVAWELNNKAALSRLLGLNDNAASMWIQNKSVPWSSILLCGLKTGKSLDWLYFGHDAICLLPESTQQELKAQLLEMLNASCQARQINETNLNGINTLANTLREENNDFVVEHGEVGHLPMATHNDDSNDN